MSEGPRWFEKAPPEPQARPRAKGPQVDQLWVRCPGCKTVLYKEQLDANQYVCSSCGHHLRVTAHLRLDAIVDEGSFQRFDAHIGPTDPLGFVDSKSYANRIQASQGKTGEQDAYIAGEATIEGIAVQIGTFNFAFMGGSMGSVVGECITRQFERAVEKRQPAIVISASGGARMQEGVLSLMQMAKVSVAVDALHLANIG